MPTLNHYLQQTQRFIRDPRQKMENPADLIDYINQARREIALRTQCIRIITPVSGSIVSATITAGGSGYTNPTVTINPPDYPNSQFGPATGLQATAIAKETGGVITDVEITLGGYGYFNPVITISDPTGTGAAVTANLSPINQTYVNQEAYPFSGVNLSMFPGVGPIFRVQDVSIIYANYRYSLPRYAFSVYQSSIRQYPFQYTYVPTMCSQLGQGTAGSLYLYPLPSQSYQMEWDCLCLPADLEDNQSVEALPEPWTDAVPYWAAFLALMELQNYNQARQMQAMYFEFVKSYSAAVRPGYANNPYGRY